MIDLPVKDALPAAASALVTRESRIPPVRGLACMYNAQGAPFSVVDAKRWIRLNRGVNKALKVDVLARGDGGRAFAELVDYGRRQDVRISLRTDGQGKPDALAGLARRGLLDVYLCPPRFDDPNLEVWASACRDAGLPMRLLLLAPEASAMDAEAAVARIRALGPAVATLAASDPFMAPAACRDAAHGEAAIRWMETTAALLEAEGIEANIVGVPFCRLEESSYSRAANRAQFMLDHQQYVRGAYDLALRLYARGSVWSGKAILMLLARHTLHRNAIDAWLLPWMLEHPWVYARVVAKHKTMRHLRWFRRTPDADDVSMEGHERALARAQSRERSELGPVCGACSLRRICDRATPAFSAAFPGCEPRTVEGDLVVSHQHFCLSQPKRYDAVDAERLEHERILDELAKSAIDITTNRPPDETITPYHYTVEKAPYNQMEGGIRWHSVTNCEKVSSPLARLTPPFTISVGFGGGIAEYVGFSFGRHCKIVCPMEGHKHEITLHADAEGRYALCRDGKPVLPSTFEGLYYVPLRLGDNLEARISCWNIDAFVVTQFVRIWQSGRDSAGLAEPPKYSVIVVTTRYARRLQAVLRSVAHQEGIDLRRIEVVVAYVPGLDGTEDLLDSMQLTYPALRIVRVPFALDHAYSKGFMINEAAAMASGEWAMLLDSDILLHPRMFAHIDALTDSGPVFFAPDGRKMLSRETTHRILLGELAPWREWDALLAESGEYRYREAMGVPIGFCQVVKTSCLREIPYTELDHFEGADMWFGMEMMKKYGKEHRLSGMPVLHLDHGGSQWYGASKHF